MAYAANASTVEQLTQRHGAALSSVTGKWFVLHSGLDNILLSVCRSAINAGCLSDHTRFHGQRYFRPNAVRGSPPSLCIRAGIFIFPTLKEAVTITTIYQLYHSLIPLSTPLAPEQAA